MFSKILNHSRFWGSVLFLSLMFMVIYNIADLILGYDFNLKAYIDNHFNSNNLIRFLFANVISGFIYGFIISFFKFKSKLSKRS